MQENVPVVTCYQDNDYIRDVLKYRCCTCNTVKSVNLEAKDMIGVHRLVCPTCDKSFRVASLNICLS